MKILDIIDKIYENSHFSTILLATTIVLIILFVIILILGLRDAKKTKNPTPEVLEKPKEDITFTPVTEEKIEKEDVTFEMPNLTKNLEEFKKNIEAEIQKDQQLDEPNNAILENNKKIPELNSTKDLNNTLVMNARELKEKEQKLYNESISPSVDDMPIPLSIESELPPKATRIKPVIKTEDTQFTVAVQKVTPISSHPIEAPRYTSKESAKEEVVVKHIDELEKKPGIPEQKISFIAEDENSNLFPESSITHSVELSELKADDDDF